MGGTDFGKGGQILAAKMVRGTSFSAKIGPAGPILGGDRFWCDRPAKHDGFVINSVINGPHGPLMPGSLVW